MGVEGDAFFGSVDTDRYRDYEGVEYGRTGGRTGGLLDMNVCV